MENSSSPLQMPNHGALCRAIQAADTRGGSGVSGFLGSRAVNGREVVPEVDSPTDTRHRSVKTQSYFSVDSLSLSTKNASMFTRVLLCLKQVSWSLNGQHQALLATAVSWVCLSTLATAALAHIQFVTSLHLFLSEHTCALCMPSYQTIPTSAYKTRWAQVKN